LERTAGGSSGGSGAALAANFTTLAIGEETFASIRRPAGWNGVASLRPTPGLVSRSGMWDGYPSPTAQMGPMARTVKDLASLLDGMVGYDPEDPVTALGIGMVDGSYVRFIDRDGLKGARIGILRESIGVQSEPESEDFRKVDTVFETNVAELKAAGAVVIVRTSPIRPNSPRAFRPPKRISGDARRRRSMPHAISTTSRPGKN
jgi:Asp-tRNA(Asn)/Glu-tRNA(Gln) amidotransferase A subunit family amidase